MLSRLSGVLSLYGGVPVAPSYAGLPALWLHRRERSRHWLPRRVSLFQRVGLPYRRKPWLRQWWRVFGLACEVVRRLGEESLASEGSKGMTLREKMKMKARWIGSEIKNQESLTQIGDIATGAENWHFNFLVKCPVCNRVHEITINKSSRDEISHQWNESTLTLQPSVKITDHVSVCHWQLTKGVFVVHLDSTASKGA